MWICELASTRTNATFWSDLVIIPRICVILFSVISTIFFLFIVLFLAWLRSSLDLSNGPRFFYGNRALQRNSSFRWSFIYRSIGLISLALLEIFVQYFLVRKIRIWLPSILRVRVLFPFHEILVLLKRQTNFNWNAADEAVIESKLTSPFRSRRWATIFSTSYKFSIVIWSLLTLIFVVSSSSSSLCIPKALSWLISTNYAQVNAGKLLPSNSGRSLTSATVRPKRDGAEQRLFSAHWLDISEKLFEKRNDRSECLYCTSIQGYLFFTMKEFRLNFYLCFHWINFS